MFIILYEQLLSNLSFGGPMQKGLSIKVMATNTGIQAHTIRTWEKRYGAFKPERAPNGRRVYTEQDLSKLKLLAFLTNSGFSISQLANQSIEELEQVKMNLNVSAPTPVERVKEVSLDRLHQFLLNYQLQKIFEELEHLRSSLGSKAFIFKVVLPVMREIGVLVAKGRYTVTHEHIVSTIIREQLSKVEKPNYDSPKESIALATPDGNLHELPILIADILCRANRTTTHYLGASHPPRCLAEALNALNCKELVMGVISTDRWDFARDLNPFLTELDQLLQNETTLVLGGALPCQLPEMNKIKWVKFMPSFEDFDEYLMERL